MNLQDLISWQIVGVASISISPGARNKVPPCLLVLAVQEGQAQHPTFILAI